MAGTSNGGSRRERESDSMEAIKPLVVLALFGMILYGAFAVVQKGPTADPQNAGGGDAPPFRPPEVQIVAPPPAVAVAPPSTAPTPSEPPAAASPSIPDQPAPSGPTFLPAQSAPPPSADSTVSRSPLDQPPPADADAPPTAPPPSAFPPPPTGEQPAPLATAGGPSSAAFAPAWADAHDKLAAGRYAEALAALSVWYDDPALGLEESQRLEDLLGQLAGTVIYSQQDLLLPPHVVAPGETLAAVAAPLGVSPRLLAKINGVEDPQRLVPGEHLKVIRGPFDAVVSVSRRRLSLQLNGAYAGSFPIVVGRRYLEKVGASLPVLELQQGVAATWPIPAGTASLRKTIVLGEGLTVEAADDPVAVADTAPPTSLLVSVRDLDELLDILGPASRVLVRQ